MATVNRLQDVIRAIMNSRTATPAADMAAILAPAFSPPSATEIAVAAALSIPIGSLVVNSGYLPGNLLRYGGMGDGVTDNTTAINHWLAISSASVPLAAALYAPAGIYLTSGAALGHVINAKQDIYGDGIGRTIFQLTNSSNRLFALPLYGGNESTVEFGGNRFRDFSCVGPGPATATTGFYVKNKTDVAWDHVEITGFGYGVQGARDNAANSCTQLTFLACRVLNNGYSLWAPLAWNACQFIGGCWEGTIWSMVLYDATATTISTNVQTSSTATGAVFMAGAQGCVLNGMYVEGYAAQLASLPAGAIAPIVFSSKDLAHSASPGGIALQNTYGNRIHGGSVSSSVVGGVPYSVIFDLCRACAIESLMSGSGISTGVAYLTTGTTGNLIGVNWSNTGTNAVYQTAADQANNFEMSVSSGISHLSTIDTANIYLDEGNASNTAEVAINKVGYQGGATIFRRCTIYDGKGTALFQVDGQNGQINLAAAKVFASSLPTSNPGAGSGQLWVNGGVVTRA